MKRVHHGGLGRTQGEKWYQGEDQESLVEGFAQLSLSSRVSGEEKRMSQKSWMSSLYSSGLLSHFICRDTET